MISELLKEWREKQLELKRAQNKRRYLRICSDPERWAKRLEWARIYRQTRPDRERHLKRVSELGRQWRQQNPEKYQAQYKKRYLRIRSDPLLMAKKREYARNYAKTPRERNKRKERGKRYYAKHPEKIAVHAKNYYNRHQDKLRLYGIAYYWLGRELMNKSNMETIDLFRTLKREAQKYG